MKYKIPSFLKNSRSYLIAICSALLVLSVRHTLSVNSVKYSSIILFIILFLYLGLIWFFFYLRQRQIPVEKLFLLFAIPLGILFIIFLPPGESPDEINHFKRIYAITEGYLVSDVYDESSHAGAPLPSGFQDSLVLMPESGAYSTVVSRLNEPVPTTTDYVPFNNTSLYHWLCYLPQVIGVLLGKLFGASLEVMAYLAEIVDFIIWILLIYFAIKFAPRFKSIIIFLSLLPITLQEATSLAPDALAIGLGIFLTSYVCHLTYVRKTKLKPQELIILYIIAIFIGYCKIVYLPLVALYLIIPAERFGSKRAKWIHAAILAALLLVLNLTWLATSSQFLREFNPGVDSKAQLSGILHNPFRYIMVLFNSFNVMGEFYFTSLLGMNLGSFSFNLPAIFFLISFAFFVIIFAQRNETLKITLTERIIFTLTFCLISLLIFTSIYIQWSPVGLSYVDGVQGRYFLPILLLVPFATVRLPQHNKIKKIPIEPERTIIPLDTTACYLAALNFIAVTMFFAQNL